MIIYYYTNRDKLGDLSIPDFLKEKGHEVIIDFIRPEISWLREKKIHFIISDRARYLIRQDVIDYMPNKIINLHPSFLPWCKGYHPILAGIINNQCLGVTIHQINAGIDTGHVLLQKPIFVEHDDTLATLYDKHREALTNLLKTNLPKLLNAQIKPKIQHPLLGSFHYKNQFNKVIEKLPLEWNSSVSWVRENISELDKYDE